MSIELQGLVKRYGDHTVVDNLSLEIADGEFFVLLGSSGSGKTTVLHMIAGLTPVDEGRIRLHGRDVTWLPPQERRVGLVFQHYALFEHMTVFENVEFGLRVRRVPTEERERRCADILELVGLTGLEKRMPRQLSGGQQQRVALARALVTRPDVLLLDEPLGALDAKIRAELRRSLKAIQRELGVTTILVTHDQTEAFELADRLGVMSFGRLIEVGEPQALYERPETEFAASFLGTANLMVGQRTTSGVQIGHLTLGIDSESASVRPGQRVQVLFRPEHVVIATEPEQLGCSPLGEALVEQCTFAGSGERVRLRLAAPPGVRPIEPPLDFGRASVSVEAWRDLAACRQLPVQPGDRVWLGVKRVHALPHRGMRIGVLADAGPGAESAERLAREIARLAQAQLLSLRLSEGAALGPRGAAVVPRRGPGVARPSSEAALELEGQCSESVEGHGCDLVIAGAAGNQAVDLAERLLMPGSHHVMIVPAAAAAPRRALVCVAAGEPGKTDVLFAGRLLRHLGAEATVLYVQQEAEPAEARARAERFLAASVRTLATAGVPATDRVRSGPVAQAIATEVASGPYDLVVVGAPLPAADGRIALGSVVGHLLRAAQCPVLIVRSAPSEVG